jgi:hypothetical protein
MMKQNSAATPEVHLFIVWENARDNERKIIDDIADKFSILRIYEIHWSKDKFSENLSRFYGANLPPNSNKELHCGTGPFLAIVVEDSSPIYEVHTTTKGDQRVNTKLFTSKALHREWTGGGHRVHGTNSVVEADHNLTMLFGKNSKDLRADIGAKVSSKPVKLSKDLEGSTGWKNLSHLFYTLNSTLPYVALRNFESFPHDYYAKDHGDIDLLVSDYREAVFVTNATAVFKSKYRVHNIVSIADEDVRFDFRFIGDGYYDSSWEASILENRIFHKNGFYTPEKNDLFYSLLYHALLQKPAIADDYAKKLVASAKSVELNLGAAAFDRNKANSQLTKFLIKKNYSVTQPKDKSVFLNMDTVRYCTSNGVRLSKERMTPMRNHLKKAKSKFKHYSKKSRKILSRNIKKIISKQYESKK